MININRYILVITITLFLLSSCNDKDNLHHFYTKGLLSDISNDGHYSYYIVIPQAGCPGCISNSEDFLLQHKDSDKYFFVITNYSSKKALFLKLGNDLKDYNNVLFDSTNNYFANSFEESIYPISIKLNYNDIEEVSIGIP